MSLGMSSLIFVCASHSFYMWYSLPSLPHCKHLSLLTLSISCCSFCVHGKQCSGVSVSILRLRSFLRYFCEPSPQSFFKFTVCMLLITSSGHVSFKFICVLSGDTVTSYIGHLMSNSSSCNLMTGPPGLLAFLPSGFFIHCVLSHPFLHFLIFQHVFAHTTTILVVNTCSTSMSFISSPDIKPATLFFLLPTALAIRAPSLYLSFAAKASA